MNRQAKSAIKSLVLALRHKLEDDIAIQLKRYGFAGERWLPLDRLPHIQRDDQAAIDHFRLKAALEQHLRRIGAEPAKAGPQQRAEAVDWFVREVAFTHLNRLVALKCLEVRDLIPEIITAREAYGGRSRAHYDYRNAHPDEARQPDDALAAAIRHVCRQVYAEFKFLFDVGDAATGHPPPANSILWPSYPVLKECIALINGLDETAGLTPDNAQHGWAPTQTVEGVESQSHRLSLRTEDEDDASHGWAPTQAVEGVEGQPRWPSLWAEDEILGWIYQFYNTEQKKAIRKRGRPRRPAEVAVINQFFTPRWIVKFLVDNTLGRLWLEMHPDSERVRAKCDYLVPEPLPRESESASQRGSKFADSQTRRFALDPDSPINNPHAPARREPKHPQDIRLIDPACGTMHFGHYAFEVFQEIYRDFNELYADERRGESANQRVDGDPQSAFRIPQSEIPAAILRYNLYGVDIDLRAVQLAGLSLFIKAKSANPDAHISHMNLVVADAVLPADGARQRFLDQYKDDRVVQDAVRQVLDEMTNVAEVGSLLRVEERLRDILAKAGHEAVRDLEPRQQQELPGLEPPMRQLSLAELPDAVPEQWGAHYTLARLLDDLRTFATEALQTHDLNAQLFAQEAEKTVHLLDVFLNDYDVVVMNPPYNKPKEMLTFASRYLKKAYPHGRADLYTAFFEKAYELLTHRGYCGALTSRTFYFLATFEDFRREFLLPLVSIRAVADLGFGVLDDAAVETSATVIERLGKQLGDRSPSAFLRLVDVEDKKQVVRQVGNRAGMSNVMPYVFVASQDDFKLTPRCSFAYWVPRRLLEVFSTYPPFSEVGDVCMGLSTADDERFLRCFWEVGRGEENENRWVPHAKGGEFSRYYQDIYLFVDWLENGEFLEAYEKSVIRNADYYFKEGLTYPHDTVKGLNVRYLPSGSTFGAKGPGIFLHGPDYLWLALGYFNSALAQQLMLLATPSRSWSVGIMQRLPFEVPSKPKQSIVAINAKRMFALKAAWDMGNETCTRFDAPWLIQAHRGTLLPDFPDLHHSNQRVAGQPRWPSSAETAQHGWAPTLEGLLDHVRAVEQAADARLQQLQAQIDEAVYDLYDISPEDRALIERELGNRPLELVWPQMERKSDEEKRCEHVRRLVSYFLLQALREKRDGILPLTPGTGQTTALNGIRPRMEAEFGEAAAFRMETEIKQVLGRDIADWLDGPFIKWHTRLYKKRPIIWQISSSDYHHTFNCFVYYHKLDGDTLRKVQTLYLWPQRWAIASVLETAQRHQRDGVRRASARIEDAEKALEILDEFEERLLAVIQAEVQCDIPDWAEGPYRGGVYDPVLDDGVKVNITPLQEAEVLRYRKVV